VKLGIDPKVTALVRMIIDPAFQGAHAICPYSNAIRSNVDVAISVSVR
jgi:organic hydroperoxide reductase OsmC/OhrA